MFRLKQGYPPIQSRLGMSILEVLVASILSTSVMAGVMFLMSASAREQKIGLVKQQVYETADILQDFITRRLQEGSRDGGIWFGDYEETWHKSIRYRTNKDILDTPQSSLIFDDDEQTLTYDPNIETEGGERVIDVGKRKLAHIEEIGFGAGLKIGGHVDSSMILVTLTVSDRGIAYKASRNTDEEHKENWITCSRSFAVNMRRD